MNLLADEGVDRQIVARLRLDDHDVLYVAEMEPGITDEIVLQRADEHSALLPTEDKDFGELVYRQHSGAFGRYSAPAHGFVFFDEGYYCIQSL